MLTRRIWQKKPWSSGCPWLLYYHSTTTHTSPPLTAASGKSPPFLARAYKSALFHSTDMLNYVKFSYGMNGCFFSSQAVAEFPVDGTVDIPLAQTGEGIAECELLQWFVKPGDQVEEFQPLCEVQSDKATIEITSRYKGEVSQILHGPGDIVKVGETLLKMFVGESPIPIQTSDTLENIQLPSTNTSDSDYLSSESKKTETVGVLSTPAVRNIAKLYGINLNDVAGTGKNGRVLKEDILKYATSAEHKSVKEYQEKAATDGRDYEDKTVQLRGFQRAMVKTMTLASKIPHFYFVEEINCDELVALKAFFQKHSDPDVKHTSLPILIKSLSMALSKYPLLNSRFSEESYEVTLKGSHNIGIAMATPSGLVVPNIKKVQSLSILEITKELARLLQLAMANKLSPDDVSGGTITLSNIGSIGGKFGSPLINAPEVAIIAIGRLQKLPRFDDDGNVYPASVMTVNIAADHRVLDGATVAYFCKEWKSFIEKPELFMLHMR